MQIIGCDLHTRQQTLAILDTTTGEVVEKSLVHEANNVRNFNSTLSRSVWGPKRPDRCSGEPHGRAGNRMPGRSPGEDSSGRAPEAETGSARCGLEPEAAGRKPLPGDLAACEGTARSAGLAMASSSVRMHAAASPECVAGDCLSERGTKSRQSVPDPSTRLRPAASANARKPRSRVRRGTPPSMQLWAISASPNRALRRFASTFARNPPALCQ